MNWNSRQCKQIMIHKKEQKHKDMYQFSITKHTHSLALTNGKILFLQEIFFAATDFSLLWHFLKAIFTQFSGRGVLLGEILLLLVLQVQFEDGSSVLFGKSDLSHIWPETQADFCICWIKTSFVGGKIEWPYFIDTWRFHTEPNQLKNN